MNLPTITALITQANSSTFLRDNVVQSRLSYREIALFFFPLVLNVQLMSISHTIINGALARLDNYVAALAGISVAMVIHLFIASASFQNHTLTITMARGKRSLISVIIFIFLTACYVSVMLNLIAYSSLGDLVIVKLMGAPPEVANEARGALKFLALLPFFTGFRYLSQGFLIRARRTGLVSLGTGIRVIALFIFLASGRHWFNGAQLGAFALVSCVICESLICGGLAWRCRQPFSPDFQERSFAEIVRYALPLAFSSSLQQTVPLLISAIIGRLSDGALALAAFGVIRGFLFLLAGPMRNLQQAHLTLVKNTTDSRRLLHFSMATAAGLAFLILLTAGPLNQLILGRLLGVEFELRSYLRIALLCCIVFPPLYALTNLLRGWFSAKESTLPMSRATLYKTLFLLLSWWPLLHIKTRLPGIIIGIALLIIAELIEAGYLYQQKALNNRLG
jgi:Na+-driven multidrug efflux pump